MNDRPLTGIVLREASLGVLSEVDNTNWSDLGALQVVKGAYEVVVCLKVTKNDATQLQLRSLFFRIEDGDSFIEQKYSGDLETVADRTHKRNLSNSEEIIYFVILTAGFKFAQIQVKCTSSGAKAEIVEAYIRPIEVD